MNGKEVGALGNRITEDIEKMTICIFGKIWNIGIGKIDFIIEKSRRRVIKILMLNAELIMKV